MEIEGIFYVAEVNIFHLHNLNEQSFDCDDNNDHDWMVKTMISRWGRRRRPGGNTRLRWRKEKLQVGNKTMNMIQENKEKIKY